MESKTIDFVVNKDKSNEVSYMDQYMVKPAKVYFENGETYVEMTLKSASYWKSFELYDESGAIAIQTVKEDHQADTKVIKFKVKPGSQSLTSKVHIVVPAINYDNKYTTHVNFKEVIPSAPTTQNSNQQDTGKVDSNDKAKDDSNQSTTDQKQDNATQNNEDTQKHLPRIRIMRNHKQNFQSKIHQRMNHLRRIYQRTKHLRMIISR